MISYSTGWRRGWGSLESSAECAKLANVKICYVDETGTDGQSPLIVMVGVIADSQRLHRTRTEFEAVMERLDQVSRRAIRELKSSELYKGNGPWRDVCGVDRHALIGDLCQWLCDRKHHLALTALDRKAVLESPLYDLDAWMSAALHIALQVQRRFQAEKSNKGRTFLVFDENKRQADPLAEMLFNPPSWTDDYYQRGPKQEALDQIVDSAFYARSHHVGLVQIADLFAFIFRRYAELHDYAAEEAFAGEAERITGWVKLISTRLIGRAHRWPKRSTGEAARWFCNVAPSSLSTLA